MAAPIPGAIAASAVEKEEAEAGAKAKSSAVTPQKIRELIDGGIAPEESGLEG